MEDDKLTIKAAFREFINRRILQRLDLSKPETVAGPASVIPTSVSLPARGNWESMTGGQQRFAYLVDDDALFAENRNIQFRDYKGKFVVL